MFNERQIAALEAERYTEEKIRIHKWTDQSDHDSIWKIAQIYAEVMNRQLCMSCGAGTFEGIIHLYQLLDKELAETQAEEQMQETIQEVKRKRGQRGKNRI
mgnify:CR=1 FL=1